MDVPRLAYIGGLSRSGSTLLELLLATAPDVVTVGELQILPHEVAGNERTDLPCGCGESVPTCPFWTAVVALHDPTLQPEPRLHYFREHYNWGHTVRPRRVPDAFRSLRASVAVRASVYLANTNELLRAVGDTVEETGGSRPAVIIDASKDPYRALWLARAPKSDVRVIHLVRDPRGSVCSLIRDSSGRIQRLVTAARRSAAWSLENALLTRLGRSLGPDRYRLVRYEDLVADPNAVVSSLASFLGIEPALDPATAYQTVSVHTIAGNPMRSDRRPVVADRRWQTEMGAVDRRIVEILTVRGRRRWGYGPLTATHEIDTTTGVPSG